MQAVATEPPPPEQPRSSPPAVGPRVLVADDSPVVLQVTVAMLTQMGCSVTGVNGGLPALDALSSGRFDLALLDCRMPDLDGIRAAQRFRELELGRRGERLPIVALTGNSEPEDRADCVAAGMDDFLGKPFGQLELLEVVRRFVPEGARRSGQPLTSAPALEARVGMARLDARVLSELEAMRPGLRQRVFGLFLRDSSPLVTTIEQAALSCDEVELVRSAHRLKSGAANVGARRLVELCGDLESCARKGDLGPAPVLAADLLLEFSGVCEEIRAQLAPEKKA